MKNRKRESCTSGTVRDEDGNILIYSARHPHANHALRRPASEKRQGTKSRWGNVGGAATMGISPRARASMWWNVAATWAILPRGMCVN